VREKGGTIVKGHLHQEVQKTQIGPIEKGGRKGLLQGNRVVKKKPDVGREKISSRSRAILGAESERTNVSWRKSPRTFSQEQALIIHAGGNPSACTVKLKASATKATPQEKGGETQKKKKPGLSVNTHSGCGWKKKVEPERHGSRKDEQRRGASLEKFGPLGSWPPNSEDKQKEKTPAE